MSGIANYRELRLAQPPFGIGGSTINSNAEGCGTDFTATASSRKNSNSTGRPSTTCSSTWIIAPSSSFPSASTGTVFTTGAFPRTWLSSSNPPSSSMVLTRTFARRTVSSLLPGKLASRRRAKSARSKPVGSRNWLSVFSPINYPRRKSQQFYTQLLINAFTGDL